MYYFHYTVPMSSIGYRNTYKLENVFRAKAKSIAYVKATWPNQECRDSYLVVIQSSVRDPDPTKGKILAVLSPLGESLPPEEKTFAW